MRDLLNIWDRARDYVTAALGIAVIVTSLGWYLTDLKLDAERLGRANDRIAYESAQHEYEAKALREKQDIEERNRQRAKEADANLNELLGKYNTALRLRYQATTGTNSGSDLSGTSGPSSGVDGSGQSPGVPSLTITYEDAEICAENTARLIVTKKWYEEVLE